jgi:hypothetical protein
LPARIRACVARPGLAKCGGAKTHKGHSPTGFLRNPNRPNRAVSSYRLLNAGFALFPSFIFFGFNFIVFISILTI